MKLSWKDKRMYHMQLEILMTVVNALLGKLMPLIFLGASAMAATNLSVLIHIDELIPNQEYFYFAVLDLLLIVFLSIVVTFMIFKLLENMTEESAGV